MKTFNRYIFTVICNINGENRKILINTFIIKNKNDDYISDNTEKYINQMLLKNINDYTDVYSISYERIIKYIFQGRYESNNDLNFIISDIVFCYDEKEKYIDCKFTNAVTNNLKLYEDKIKEWNEKIYNDFKLVYKEK